MRLYRGDKVRIKKLPSSMSHFPGEGTVATVVYAYGDEYGGRDFKNYSLKVKGAGQVSWYPISVLELVQRRTHCPECKQKLK